MFDNKREEFKLIESGREKLMKLDVKRREYDIVVIGEEPFLAYNRVGLTSYFQHQIAENLYLNPEKWVRIPILNMLL